MKVINYILIFIILSFASSFADNHSDFLVWKENFKKVALQNDISEKTFDKVMANVKFLPNVIKYDRYQPEFYEDTKTYITKRTSSKKVSKGLNFYKNNSNFIQNQWNASIPIMLFALMLMSFVFGKENPRSGREGSLVTGVLIYIFYLIYL